MKAYKLLIMKVDSPKPKRTGVLLKGLGPIRKALGLRQDVFAQLAGIHPTHLSRLENLKQGSSDGTVTALAGILCCKIADLLDEPTDLRKAQIAADYDERRASKSRALASRLEKKSGAA